MHALLELMGWLGGLMVAGGYIMVSLRRIAPDSGLFQLLNVVGAASLGISCVVDGALPPACLNAIWLVVGVRSMIVAPRSGQGSSRDAGALAWSHE